MHAWSIENHARNEGDLNIQLSRKATAKAIFTEELTRHKPIDEVCVGGIPCLLGHIAASLV